MLDPTEYKDWQIAEEAEKSLPSVDWFREKMGLLPEEIIPYGKTPKLDFIRIMSFPVVFPTYIVKSGKTVYSVVVSLPRRRFSRRKNTGL